MIAMNRFVRVAGAMSLLMVSGAALAQNVTGLWKGSLVVDTSKLPKPKDEAQKKQMDAAMAMVRGIKVSLDMKANKTFVMKVTGLPQMTGADGKKTPEGQTAEGTWTQSGNKLTLKVTKSNGAAPKGENPPQQVLILEGGKKLELTPTGGGMGGKVIFVR